MNAIKAKPAMGYFAPLADSKYMLLSDLPAKWQRCQYPRPRRGGGGRRLFQDMGRVRKRQKASPQHLCPGRSLHDAGPAPGRRLSGDGGASGG